MTLVTIKKSNKEIIKKELAPSPRPKASPEMFKILKDLKKIVPDKSKRLAVIKLVSSASLSFNDALQVINEYGFKSQPSKIKLLHNLSKKTKLEKNRRKAALAYLRSIPDSKPHKNKVCVRILSGGGGPGTGKRR